MIVLALSPISLVNANDFTLQLVSGSNCDPRIFEYQGHTVAQGFAASICADLPFETFTQLKVGCAIAGLGESWVLNGPGYYITETPYVDEITITVEGDASYTSSAIAAYDNSGTGGQSMPLFELVLTGIDIIFNAWTIYNWLAQIYQQPPVAELHDYGH
jgi:hypothetical protein